MLIDWQKIRSLNLPSVNPNSKDWLGDKQIIYLPHMTVSINPPAPTLHSLKISRLHYKEDNGECAEGTFLLDKEGVIGLVIGQKVKVRKSKLKKFGISL